MRTCVHCTRKSWVEILESALPDERVEIGLLRRPSGSHSPTLCYLTNIQRSNWNAWLYNAHSCSSVHMKALLLLGLLLRWPFPKQVLLHLPKLTWDLRDHKNVHLPPIHPSAIFSPIQRSFYKPHLLNIVKFIWSTQIPQHPRNHPYTRLSGINIQALYLNCAGPTPLYLFLWTVTLRSDLTFQFNFSINKVYTIS